MRSAPIWWSFSSRSRTRPPAICPASYRLRYRADCPCAEKKIGAQHAAPLRCSPCLESLGQTEPYQPVFLRPVEGMHDVHLADRVPQQIHAERYARAADPVARAPEQFRALALRPRHAGVIENARFDRQDAVVPAARAE